MNLLKSFKKNGFVHLKNFFSENDIDVIDKRAKEKLYSKFDYIYKINKYKIENSFLNKKKFNDLRNKLLKFCESKELKIQSLEKFIGKVKPLLKNNYQSYYLEKLHALFLENHQSNTDMLYDDVYSSIFLKEKVLDVYRELLQTNEIIYYGESHVDFNKPYQRGLKKTTSRGWHSDDFYNHNYNTSEPTYNIRGALWYHSNSECSGGTKFLPGSHFYVRPVKQIKKVVKKILLKKNMNNSLFNTRFLLPKNIYPSKRDFLLWDKRLLHSAWAVKLKILKNLVLPPFLENYLSSNDNLKILMENNSFPRSLANLDFGRKSKSLDLYLDTYGRRNDYRSYWNDKKVLLSNDFISKLKNRNIKFDDKAIKVSEKNLS